MSAHTCSKCMKSFRDGVTLKRHSQRTRPCIKAKPHTCAGCDKAYTDVSSLYRHRKECLLYAKTLESHKKETTKSETELFQEKKVELTVSSQPVTVVHNIQNINNIHVNALGKNQQFAIVPSIQAGGNTTAISGPNSITNSAILQAAPGSDPFRFPGWPDKWPAPSVLPAPFKPLGFEISQPELEAAVGSLTEDERASCARGDTLGVARLLVEILKRVHSDPKERNVYLNPSRSDQALVFIPESWSAQPLEEAAQSLFARIRVLLNDVETSAERGVKSAVIGARRGCVGKLPQLARASRGQLAAHLENVRRATASGEDWLGTGGEPMDQPAFIGKEHVGHLNPQMLASALEQASGVYSEGDVREGTAVGQVSRAMAECARYMLHTCPTNLSVVEVEGEVYAHEREAGWVPWPRDRAAEAILRRASWAIDSRLRDVPDTPLVALRPWLRERLPEVLSSPQGREAAERVIWHYAQAASRYYSALPRVQDPHDRKEAARCLIMGEAPQRINPRQSLAYAPVSVEGRLHGPEKAALTAPQPALTDAELEEMLGW